MEGLEEYHVTMLALKKLKKMPKVEELWGAKMGVFKEIVQHHIKGEERKVFKSAQKALNLDEIQNIMKQFEQEAQKIKKSLK